MRTLSFIALAGALGSLSRYGVGHLAKRLLGDAFPHGTLVVNVVGCFLLGLLAEVFVHNESIPVDWRLPLTVGFLGAFTTFSTFGYETMRYVAAGAWLPASANVAANLGIGFLAVAGGFALARVVVG